MLSFKQKSNKVRYQLNCLKRIMIDKGALSNTRHLYFSDHLCDRIIERKLEGEVDFIAAITENFMVNIFNHTTYVDRKYCVQYKKLKVGISVHLGAIDNLRHAVVSTAFTSDIDYKCDEKIILK